MTDSNKGVNSPEGEGESPEKQNKKNKAKSQDVVALKRDLIKKYLKSKYWSDANVNQRELEHLIQEVFVNGKIPYDFEQQLDAFKQKKEKKYKGVNIGEVVLEDVKELMGPYVVLKWQMSQLKEMLKKDIKWTLTSAQEMQLDLKIRRIDKREIRKILKSNEKKRNLLGSIEGIQYDIPFKDIPSFFLEIFNSDEFKQRKQSFTNEQKACYSYFMQYLEDENTGEGKIKFQELDQVAVEEIYKNLFNNEERKKFLKEFFPTVSYTTLQNLLSDDELKKVKKRKIKNSLPSWVFLESENLDQIVYQNILNDAEFDMEEVLASNPYAVSLENFIEHISLSAMQGFVNDYNESLKSMRSWITWSSTEALNKIKEHPNTDNWQVFSPWSTLEIVKVKKDKDGKSKEEKFYLDIVSIDDVEWTVRFENKWSGSYDLRKTSLSRRTESIKDLYTYLNEWDWDIKVFFNFYTKEQLNSAINSWNIHKNENNLDWIKEIDLESETADLNEKILRKEEQLRAEWKTNEEIEEDEERKQLTIERDKKRNINKEVLQKKIDEEDSEGQDFWFGPWVVFMTASGSYFTIKKLSWDNIEIASVNWHLQSFRLFEFFEIFKESGCKRLSKARGWQDLLEQMRTHKDVSGDWWNISFNGTDFEKDGGGIVWWKEDKNKEPEKKKYKCDIFESHNSDMVVKIYWVDWDKVTMSFWERKWKKEKRSEKEEKQKQQEESKKNKKEKKKEPIIYSIDRKKHTVSVWALAALFNKEAMTWVSLEESKASKKDELAEQEAEKYKIKRSLWDKYMRFHSLSNIQEGLTMWWENYTSRLKEWSEEKGALLANGIVSHLPFVPTELKSSFKARTEQAQKKRREWYIEQLKDIDSGDATEQIKLWLLSSDTQPYKIQAWLEFMFMKYGHLYAKRLTNYQGSFLWYRSMGWRVNDSFFQKIKAEVEARNENFSEEELVYQYVREICKKSPYWPSRYHKIIKRLRAQWKEEEIETWKRDSGDERTIVWRINGAYWEMFGWTIANTAWWAGNIIEKGWTYAQMNEIPFALAFTGEMYDMDTNKLRDVFKNFQANNYLVPMTRFFSYKSDIELLNRVILGIAVRLQQLDESKYGTIWDDAKKIFDAVHAKKWDRRTRIENVREFYNKKTPWGGGKTYWELLTKALYNLNDGDKSEYGRIWSLLEVESEKGYHLDGKEREGNKDFHTYYSMMKDYAGLDGSFNKSDDLMTDAFNMAWSTGINERRAFTQTLLLNSGWGFNFREIWPMVAWELERKLRNIVYTPMADNPVADKSIKMKLIKNTLRNFTAAMIEVNGSRPEALKEVMKAQLSFLGNWWVDILQVREAGYSYQNFDNGDPWAEEFVERWAENVYNYPDRKTRESSSLNIPQRYKKRVADRLQPNR